MIVPITEKWYLLSKLLEQLFQDEREKRFSSIYKEHVYLYLEEQYVG